MKTSVNPKNFRAYDIRGIYPSELNAKSAFLIGSAFARKTKARQVVVGRDMRNGGEALKKGLIKGLAAGGAKEVVDIGLVPIDAVYFSVGILKYSAAIMITASHNPKEYNGFKMVYLKKNEMGWMRGEELLAWVREAEKQVESKPNKARLKKLDIYPKYIKHVMSFTKVKNIKPLKVVVDAGNGMAGKVMPMLEKKLPIKVVRMFYKLDGNFPNRPSNPLLKESQAAISKKIRQVEADFGVLIDGDTDRLIFVDEKGKAISADITLLLLARLFLDREPGVGIAYNLICSNIVPEKIKEWGGRPIRTKVGFVNVANGMKKGKGIMGGELSSHYSFRDNAYADSGFIALVIMLELLSKLDKPLSQIVKPYYGYYKLPEINRPVKDIGAKLKEIKKKYGKYRQDYLDGVTVSNWEKGDWWFNVRPSNTEPLLRFTIEGRNKKAVDKLKKELAAE